MEKRKLKKQTNKQTQIHGKYYFAKDENFETIYPNIDCFFTVPFGVILFGPWRLFDLSQP